MKSIVKLGLIGKGISHSKSPEMYQQILDFTFDYELLDYSSESELPALEELSRRFLGLSITAPYKPHYFNQVEKTEAAIQAGVINCLYFKDSNVFGHNTDYSASKRILSDMELNKFDEVLVLGSGSMAHMLRSVFSELEIDYKSLSRKVDGPLENLDLENRGKLLVINSCSRAFCFNGKLDKKSVFWDLNYDNQPNRDYLMDKVCYVDGVELLREQAIDAAKFWNLLQ